MEQVLLQQLPPDNQLLEAHQANADLGGDEGHATMLNIHTEPGNDRPKPCCLAFDKIEAKASLVNTLGNSVIPKCCFGLC